MNQEHKDKISKANKGKSKKIKHDKQFKKGHTPWNLNNGVRLNDALIEWRKNGGEPWNKGLKGVDNPNTGRKVSEEGRKRMSEAAQKRAAEQLKDKKYIKDDKGRIKVEFVCKDCKTSFYKREDTVGNWSGRCVECAKKHRKNNAKWTRHGKSEVTCKDCGKKWFKRNDLLSKWAGRCVDCCQKYKHSTPEAKERCRENMAKQRIAAPEKFIIKPKYGAEHWNWKGDLVSKHKRIRGSLEYKAWRKSVFERDNYTCQFCGVRGVEIHADHILPFSKYPDLRLELSNGRTLCKPCHIGTDTYGFKKKQKVA